MVAPWVSRAVVSCQPSALPNWHAMDESARPRPGPGAAESGETPEAPAVPEPPAVPAPPPEAAVPPEPAEPTGHTRRWVLAGALAIVAGGGAGVGAAFRR